MDTGQGRWWCDDRRSSSKFAPHLLLRLADPNEMVKVPFGVLFYVGTAHLGVCA